MQKLIWLLVFTLFLTACGYMVGAPSPSGYQTTLIEGEAATVTDVFDGDTIEVELDGRTYRVRYIGIDTPERDEPFYEEATLANRQLVGGQELILVKDVSETDQYGRLLRYIYLTDGTFVNAELLRQGYAQIVTYPPDVAMQEEFQALQTDARTAGRGLWSISEPVDPAAPSGCAICDRNAYNCADFVSQTSAQACYDYCFNLSGDDVHHLDGGGDGAVCESLP